MPRCFIGLALPPRTHQALRPLLASLASLRAWPAQIRPVPEINLHCTLKFLGPIAEDRFDALRSALARVAERWTPFSAEAAGLDVFGAPHPRAVYASVRQGREALVKLSDAIDLACEPLGFAREQRPRVPHVTLARVSDAGDADFILAWTQQPAHAVAFGPLDTTRLLLYQSETGPNGSVYTPLHTFAVGQGAD